MGLLYWDPLLLNALQALKHWPEGPTSFSDFSLPPPALPISPTPDTVFCETSETPRPIKEKGVAEDEMVGWHHRLNGHEFEHTPRDNDGQGSLACCSPWGHKESYTTERLNNNRNTKLVPVPGPLHMLFPVLSRDAGIALFPWS